MRRTLAFLKAPDRISAVVLVSSAILPVAYAFYGHPTFFLDALGGRALGPEADLWAQVWRFASMFVLFFAVPAVLALGVLKLRPADLGLRLGDWRYGLKFVVLAMAVLIPSAWISSAQPDMQAEYPMSKWAMLEPGRFAAYEASYLLYYIGWEAFFRGYMLFGLRERYGDFGAIAFQAFPSILLHIVKPAGEAWASVVAAFAFGAVALRTRSFVWVLSVHYLLGVVNDVCCAIRAGGL